MCINYSTIPNVWYTLRMFLLLYLVEKNPKIINWDLKLKYRQFFMLFLGGMIIILHKFRLWIGPDVQPDIIYICNEKIICKFKTWRIDEKIQINWISFRWYVYKIQTVNNWEIRLFSGAFVRLRIPNVFEFFVVVILQKNL